MDFEVDFIISNDIKSHPKFKNSIFTDIFNAYRYLNINDNLAINGIEFLKVLEYIIENILSNTENFSF